MLLHALLKTADDGLCMRARGSERVGVANRSRLTPEMGEKVNYFVAFELELQHATGKNKKQQNTAGTDSTITWNVTPSMQGGVVNEPLYVKKCGAPPPLRVTGEYTSATDTGRDEPWLLLRGKSVACEFVQ